MNYWRKEVWIPLLCNIEAVGCLAYQGIWGNNGDLIGDFTKYGHPVPRFDPTRGVGIAHFQFWGWRYPSCAQTVPFFLRMDIFSQYAKVINSINPRDSYMHQCPGSPLTQVMA